MLFLVLVIRQSYPIDLHMPASINSINTTSLFFITCVIHSILPIPIPILQIFIVFCCC